MPGTVWLKIEPARDNLPIHNVSKFEEGQIKKTFEK